MKTYNFAMIQTNDGETTATAHETLEEAYRDILETCLADESWVGRSNTAGILEWVEKEIDPMQTYEDWCVGNFEISDGFNMVVVPISPPIKPEETPTQRLEYLRGELRAERISAEGLCELESLAEHIEPGDMELLEPAGVPEEQAHCPVCRLCRERHDPSRGLSFDGYGINLCDMYRSRELSFHLTGANGIDYRRKEDHPIIRAIARILDRMTAAELIAMGDPETPAAIVHVSGGMVQGIDLLAGLPIEVRDYDTEGADENDPEIEGPESDRYFRAVYKKK